MELGQMLVLFAAGIVAGGVNAIAGGGTFFTFPALLAAGLPPVAANASNAVAVWPGHAVATLSYRQELARNKGRLVGSGIVALLGGSAGALLLLRTGDATFTALIPALLIAATLIFACKRWLEVALSALRPGHAQRRVTLWGWEFAIAVYGGYFGAGLGVLMLAGLALTGLRDLHQLNALKNLLSAIIASIAVVLFVVADAVSWPHATLALVGSVIGGWLGVRVAKRIPARWLERAIVAIGGLLSLYYALNIWT